MSRTAKRTALIGVLVGATAIAVMPLAGVTASAANPGCTSPSNAVNQDYNGGGRPDLVVGLPGAHHGMGAIEIRRPGHLEQIYKPGADGVAAMPAGAHFGAVSAAVDLNHDGCDDLLVSAPGLTVNGVPGAGGVQVFFGGHELTAGPLLTQDGSAELGTAVRNAHFGAALDTSVVTGAAAVGAPGASVTNGSATLRQAGEVFNFSLGADGRPDHSFSDTETMPQPQAGAHFGTTLYAGAVGAPDASHGAKLRTGFFEFGLGYSNGAGATAVFGKAAGDRLGSSFAWLPADNSDFVTLFAGAPGHKVRGKPGAGAVLLGRFSPDAGRPTLDVGRTLTQAGKGVPGKPARNAHFGATLGSVITEASPPGKEAARLVIGIPGEKVKGHKNAGGVDVKTVQRIPSQDKRSVSWLHKTLATRGVPGHLVGPAALGAALSTEQITDRQAQLAIGVPGTGRGAGSVVTFQVGIGKGLGNVDRLRHEGPFSPNAHFGASVN